MGEIAEKTRGETETEREQESWQFEEIDRVRN